MTRDAVGQPVPYSDVLIVGGGHAGAQTAISLVQRGYKGSIRIVTDERDLPYERPALSKEYLLGEKAFERLLLKPEVYWASRNIDISRGQRIEVVDAANRLVCTQRGGSYRYGTMVWAAGGSPRRLACSGGGGLAGVHSVRSREDVDQLLKELPACSHVAIIGGGYIGLEAAAALRKLDRQVTLLETADRVLSRVAGKALSEFFEAEHRRQGVDIRLCTQVECIEESFGRAAGVRLGTGEIVSCDLVIVGIGILPAVGPLLAAGAAGENGVLVDQFCATTLPNIYAVGDCAVHSNVFADGTWIRLESVQNANDMAQTAARAILGDAAPYSSVPWFWSNQYDLRLQTVGLSTGHDLAIVRGDVDSRSFSIVYLREGKVVALDCVNTVRDFAQGRALVVERASIDVTQLADASIPLKELDHAER